LVAVIDEDDHVDGSLISLIEFARAD